MNIEKLKRNETAEIFGKNPKTITRWNQDGMPRNSDGTYNLRNVIQWREEKIADTISPGLETEESQKWLTAFRKERALIAKIERKKLEEKLIPKGDVLDAWAWRLKEVAKGLQALAMRLPPLLVGKSQSEMRSVVDNEQWRMRDNFSRTGKFCPEIDKQIFKDALNAFDRVLERKLIKSIKKTKKKGVIKR